MSRVTSDEIEDFVARHPFWTGDWAAFAGKDALADQVRFEREWTALRDYARQHGVRIFGDIPIYDFVVGNGEGEVPLAKLERHLTKLPANITAKQMDSLESRLAALGSRMGPAAMPKGPLPGGAKMRGVQRTVRRK